MHDRQPQSLTRLLFERQLAPSGRHICSDNVFQHSTRTIDSWAESDSLKRCSASYCQLNPPPRSTIAAAFSPDGKLVASTHGDHTVKVICVRTGKCLQTLTGHRRTPWVVRFHPTSSSLLASGSLDYEVRLWNADTAECINVHNFGRPIASLAFHIEGDTLAVASGHKLYMWQYTRQQQGEEGAPPVALKTRRSLRAVHFHPLGLPLVLTAEVNDINAPITLPHGVHAMPPAEAPPQGPIAEPRSSWVPVGSREPSRQPSDLPAVNRDPASTDSQADDWPVERHGPRRLSEVFRALMQEEREEELMAQLESSASQQAAHLQGSASRQILGLTGHGQSHASWQQQQASHALSEAAGSLPHAPVPIRQSRPPSRLRSFHPLRHSIDEGNLGMHSSLDHQTASTPFSTARSQFFGANFAAASADQSSHSHHPIQQRAHAWAQLRQQERSVLNQRDSLEIEPNLRTQSGLPDAAGSSIRANLQHTSPRQAHNWAPMSPRGNNAHGLGRRQSEPLRSMDEEWPVLGTPPVTQALLPPTPPLLLPPPSPQNPLHTPVPQPPQATFASAGLAWAQNLARGAEWMGEATGLRFLTRPFSRTVAGMTGAALTGSAAEPGSSQTTEEATTSSNENTADSLRQSLERQSSSSRLMSASAPGDGSMSYRERLLLGAGPNTTTQNNRQGTNSFTASQQPPPGSQFGFPSQQELQASASSSRQQSVPNASSSAVPSPSPSVAPLSALSFSGRQATLPNVSSRSGQTQPSTPVAASSRRFSADFVQSCTSNRPRAVPVLSQAVQDTSQGPPEFAPQGSSSQAPQAASVPAQHTAAHLAVGTQTGMPAAPAPGSLAWPAQLAAESQGALPPSMLNMGWEYPAPTHLLQVPDPLAPASFRTARDHAHQQPNHMVANAVRTSAAAAHIIGTEQPCRVRLRLWHCSAADPTAALEAPSLTIPDAVLCSEMGVHFSACGRYLAACVACQASHLHDLNPDAAGITYEVRVYSLEAATLGQVLHAKQIKAAHCLTSVQFSPTSEHLLLAYGRRHISLLRSLVPDGTSSIIPVHTILEVYRVSDMSLVRVLPSAEDEVNAAAFHPHAGGGLAYGTKEGKLRILRHDPRPEARTLATCQQPRGLDDELREAESISEDDVLL